MGHDLAAVEFNLADLWECVADAVAPRLALVCGERRLTYAALDERATRLAHGLASLGVARNDHVGLYLYNCAEYVETMLACYKLRAVPLNVNWRYVADELAYLLDDGDVVAVVTEADLLSTVQAVQARLPKLRSVIATGADYEGLVTSASPRRDFEPRSADDHYLLYTGGTTGLPKGVVWRHEDIFFATLGGGNPGGPPITRPEQIGETVLTNMAQRARPFLPPGTREPDRFAALALGPLMHASGQWSALGTLLGGGTSVVYPLRQMDMDRVLELVEDERVVMLTLVGDTSGRPLADALEAHPGRRDTSSLLLLGSGGSILSASVKARLLASLPTVLAISEAVGSSEAPVQGVAIAQAGPQTSLRFSVREVTTVLDDDLRPVVPGSGVIGRLATRGHVPLGYHNDPVKTAATFVEAGGFRWSLPGDMAIIEADGTVRLLGRGSLCINTGGEKVYPEEVEAVLKGHSKVGDALIIGAPDERWGEHVVAVVAAASSADPPELEELQGHCRAHLAG
ncbi:MAG TPA: AMP-binding protein, partial [Acidimicrobiales bacterium]|nr:AMP-binding protein [Acidimicrobiales bacterium]